MCILVCIKKRKKYIFERREWDREIGPFTFQRFCERPPQRLASSDISFLRYMIKSEPLLPLESIKSHDFPISFFPSVKQAKAASPTWLSKYHPIKSFEEELEERVDLPRFDMPRKRRIIRERAPALHFSNIASTEILDARGSMDLSALERHSASPFLWAWNEVWAQREKKQFFRGAYWIETSDRMRWIAHHREREARYP